jgi:hypothetical protein
MVLVVVLLAAACGEEPRRPAPGAPAAPPAKAPATQPSGYRTNPALPHGSILVSVRARAAAESRVADIPAGFRSRNPPDEMWLVDPATLGVRDVAVSIKAIAEGLLPPLPRATLDNACCRFSPHVLFVPVGQKVLLKNSDPMSHATMISTLGGSTLFSVTIPSGETAETTTVDHPGILSVSCPIHAWMSAWLIGARHPYVAVTDAAGAARLAQVPAGTHDVVFWHQRLGSVSRSVAVAAGAETRLDLDDSAFTKR